MNLNSLMSYDSSLGLWWEVSAVIAELSLFPPIVPTVQPPLVLLI